MYKGNGKKHDLFHEIDSVLIKAIEEAKRRTKISRLHGELGTELKAKEAELKQITRRLDEERFDEWV